MNERMNDGMNERMNACAAASWQGWAAENGGN
jgi:hypothetical protein